MYDVKMIIDSVSFHLNRLNRNIGVSFFFFQIEDHLHWKNVTNDEKLIPRG